LAGQIQLRASENPEAIVNLQHAAPAVVAWVDRWGLRVGLGVFAAAVLLNLATTATAEWAPFAAFCALFGPMMYFMVQFVVRIHLWIRNPFMSREGVRTFLIAVLLFSGVLAFILAFSIIRWPRQALPDLFGVSLPTGMALSAAASWKYLGKFPSGKARP
jgi:hypothetical protein